MKLRFLKWINQFRVAKLQHVDEIEVDLNDVLIVSVPESIFRDKTTLANLDTLIRDVFSCSYIIVPETVKIKRIDANARKKQKVK